MKRKDYEKPTMDVVEVKIQPQLLAGSVNATGNLNDPTDYESETDPFTF